MGDRERHEYFISSTGRANLASAFICLTAVGSDIGVKGAGTGSV